MTHPWGVSGTLATARVSHTTTPTTSRDRPKRPAGARSANRNGLAGRGRGLAKQPRGPAAAPRCRRGSRSGSSLAARRKTPPAGLDPTPPHGRCRGGGAAPVPSHRGGCWPPAAPPQSSMLQLHKMTTAALSLRPQPCRCAFLSTHLSRLPAPKREPTSASIPSASCRARPCSATHTHTHAHAGL